MEDDERIRIIEKYTAFWQQQPKSEVLCTPERTAFCLLLDIGGRWLFLFYWLGRRGAIKELAILLDPQQRFQLDRLQHYHEYSSYTDYPGGTTRLGIECYVRDEKLSFEEACRRALQETIEDPRKESMHYSGYDLKIDGCGSVRHINTGLPSLGRYR